MNKCEHGQKIIYFCASQNCQYKQSAGCELCIKKYHNHITNINIINEQTIQNMTKKYTVDNKIKPKCRVLQQTLYHYFNTIKVQLTNSLENLSKNLINQVGYPFLYKHNAISMYKKLKNRQYRKIIQKQFKVYYQISNKLQEKQFLKQESSIYEKQTKNISDLINSLQNFIGSYQLLSKKFQLNFVHDRNLITGFNDIIRNIHDEISTNKGNNNSIQSQINKFNEKVENSAEIIRNNMVSNTTTNDTKYSKNNDNFMNKSKDENINQLSNDSNLSKTNRYDLKIQLNKLNNHDNIASDNKSFKFRAQKERPPSIDKTILNSQRFNNNSSYTERSKETNLLSSDQGSKETVSYRQNGKIQTLKLQLNTKQIEINQKKKFLLDMMRSKQQRSSSTIIKPKLEFKQSFGKPSFAKKDNIIHPEQSALNKSVQKDSIQRSFQNTRQQAFAKLPAEQISNKFIQKLEAKKKLIVVPTITSFSNTKQVYNNCMESVSPLYKKKITESRMTLSKQTDTKNQKKQIETKNGEAKIQFKENEQNSLALFLKSLNLKAEQAVTYLCSSLKHADNNLSAAQYLSYLYLYLNRPKECLQVCNKILQKYQNSAEQQLFIEINNNKSVALNTLGRYSESIVILQKCIKCKQKDLIFKNLGDAYFSIGMNDKAIYNYQKCLKLNSSFDEAHYNLAACLYLQGNYNNAKLQILKALQLQHKNEQYLQLQMNINLKSKNFN